MAPLPVRPQTAEPAKRHSRGNSRSSAPVTAVPRTSTSGREDKYGLGQRPKLAATRAEELCGLDEAELALLPMSKLEAIQADLVSVTADASASLAWLLQLKDALAHDSAT